MAESIDQHSFFGSSGMHYMSPCATATMGDDDGQTMEVHQHDAHLSLQDCMSNPIIFHAEMMGEIMYPDQALCQPDAAHIAEAVITEINSHVNHKHWQLTKQSKVPPDNDVFPSVWPMYRKRDITSNEISEYKACLNLHGRKQEYIMNNYETYAPVVTWFSIHLLIVIGILSGWSLHRCNYTADVAEWLDQRLK